MQNPHTDTAQTLYEGDQSKLYSGLMSHHHGQSVQSEASRRQIKRILKVTLWLSAITIVEVGLGLIAGAMGMPRGILNTIFLILTLAKATYIVSVFMHLGDELRNFMIIVLIPLALFIWFIIAFLADGSFWLKMNNNTPTRIESNVTTKGSTQDANSPRPETQRGIK